MKWSEITRSPRRASSRELKHEIHRALKPISGVDRHHLLPVMYGLPDESEKEGLELERLRAEIEVKRADAAKKRSEAGKARSAALSHMDATVSSYFVIYQDARSEWRWTLFAKNGRKIAESGEGYESKAVCQRSINLLKGMGSALSYER